MLAYMVFDESLRSKLHSTNPLERVNQGDQAMDQRGRDLPNREALIRLVGALMLEQNDKWQIASRYMMVEAFAQIDDKEENDPILSITTKAA